MRIEKNYTKVPNEYLYDPDLTASEFRVLTALLSFGWENNPSFPSQEIVSEKLGISPRAIRYTIKKLSDKGYISFKRRGFNKSNEYTFLTLGKSPSSDMGSALPANNTIKKTMKNINEEDRSIGMKSIRETLSKKGILKHKKL